MSEDLIVGRGLARHYAVGSAFLSGGRLLRALDGLDLTVRPQRTLAIVGESGCGKSTLARLLTMIERPTSGTLTICGTDVAAVPAGQIDVLRRSVQMVFQDPYGSLNPRKRVSDMLEEPLLINTPMRGGERRDAGLAMLERVGLKPEHYRRYPHMFSGGQRQRIAIARALMLTPRVLVLDEPVSALDVSIQAQILNLLVSLQESSGLAYVFISHALTVVRHIADEVIVMYLGRAVETGTRNGIFGSARHPYTQALLQSAPSTIRTDRRARLRLKGELPSPINPPAGCTFHPRCAYANERCRVEVPQPIPTATGTVRCHGVEERRVPEQALEAA